MIDTIFALIFAFLCLLGIRECRQIEKELEDIECRLRANKRELRRWRK